MSTDLLPVPVKTPVKRPTRQTTRTKPKVASAPKVAELVKSFIKPKPRKISEVVGRRIKGKSLALNILTGADPEAMIWDREEGRIVSAIPILKCGKHDPIDLGGGVKLFADCTLCEFNIKPAADKAEFVANIRDAMSRVQNHLGDRYRLFPQAAHDYADAEMQPAYGIDPQQIGCTPSICGLRETINLPAPFDSTMRTGSFHVHIGNAAYEGKNDGRLLTYDSRHDAMKLVALYMGLGTVVYSKDVTSQRRRAIYGRGHEMRQTPYGLEARLGEPYSLRSPEMVGLVYDLTHHALSHIRNRTEKDVLKIIDSHAVEAAINACDKGAALAILKTTDLPADLMARIQQDYGMPDVKEAWKL